MWACKSDQLDQENPARAIGSRNGAGAHYIYIKSIILYIMSKISTDTLLSRRISKKERIEELENLISRSRSQIGTLTREVDQIEQQVLDNMEGVDAIQFK